MVFLRIDGLFSKIWNSMCCVSRKKSRLIKQSPETSRAFTYFAMYKLKLVNLIAYAHRSLLQRPIATKWLNYGNLKLSPPRPILFSTVGSYAYMYNYTHNLLFCRQYETQRSENNIPDQLYNGLGLQSEITDKVIHF